VTDPGIFMDFVFCPFDYEKVLFGMLSVPLSIWMDGWMDAWMNVHTC
jgi:hypothetical protein